MQLVRTNPNQKGQHLQARAHANNPNPRYGGELVSLSINHTAREAFAAAGYADIATNDSYTGGMVRQHGNLSFARVFQAGHDMVSHQPETALAIFNRALFDRDIATGLQPTGECHNYSSQGPSDTLHVRHEPPAAQPVLSFCYQWRADVMCTDDQKSSMLNGSATVCNYILKDENSTVLFPELMGRLEDPACARNGPAPATFARSVEHADVPMVCVDPGCLDAVLED